MLQPTADALADAHAEIARLRTENAGIADGLEAARIVVKDLRADIERLKAIILGFTGHFVTREMSRTALEGKS